MASPCMYSLKTAKGTKVVPSRSTSCGEPSCVLPCNTDTIINSLFNLMEKKSIFIKQVSHMKQGGQWEPIVKTFYFLIFSTYAYSLYRTRKLDKFIPPSANRTHSPRLCRHTLCCCATTNSCSK